MKRPVFCLLALLAPTAAGAQEPLSRVHVGAQVPAVVPTDAAGLRLDIRRTDRESMEISFVRRHNADSGDFIEGPRKRAFFSVSYKRRFFTGADRENCWFVTIGGMGYYKPAGNPEVINADEQGRRFINPIRRGRIFMPPVLPVIGAGVERRLGRHVGLHADVQLATLSLLPLLTPITHVGVFVPLGTR